MGRWPGIPVSVKLPYDYIKSSIYVPLYIIPFYYIFFLYIFVTFYSTICSLYFRGLGPTVHKSQVAGLNVSAYSNTRSYSD